jgi:orotate phosphoribosyltransferase
MDRIAKDIQSAVYRGNFIRSDGSFESFFVDPIDFVTDWKLLNSVSDLFAFVLKKLKANKIFIERYGSLHLATLISQKSKLSLIVVRKPLEKSLAWTLKGDVKDKEAVVGVDEITMTGDRIFEVVHILRKNGLNVKSAVSFIDLCRGARENLGRIGVKLIPLFEVSEKNGKIDVSKSQELEEFLANSGRE